MTGQDSFRSHIADWLRDEAESEGPPAYLEPVLARTEQTKQIDSWRRPWRWFQIRAEQVVTRQSGFAWVTLVAILLVSAIAVVNVWPRSTIQNGMIAFSTDAGLYGVEPDGSGMHLISAGLELFHNAWSPDGSRLLVRDRQGAVRAIGPDGSDPEDLTGAEVQVRAVSWAPGGSEIAFSGYDPGDPTRARIYLVEADGSDLRPFVAEDAVSGERGPLVGDDPSWSPDGRWLAFVKDRAQLWVVRADGRELRSLGGAPGVDESGYAPISWSPDSSDIAYQRVASSVSGRASRAVFISSLARGDEQRASTDALDQVSPTWAPQGSRIAWLMETTSGYTIVLYDVAAADGDVVATAVGMGTEWLEWSPDGRWLASVTVEQRQLAIISVDGTEQSHYVTGAGAITGLAWQPIDR